MIYVLKILNKVKFNTCQIEYLKSILSKENFEFAFQYQKWQDQQAYLCGRLLLLEGLRKLNISPKLLSDLKFTEYGRPYLPINIDFNISHSGEFVLLGICKGSRIGIDIEQIRNINIEEFKNYFTESELASFDKSALKFKRFFKLWTIKEAISKADGRGLNLDYTHIISGINAYSSGQPWFVQEVEVDANYIAHVATDLDIAKAVCETISIPNRK